MKKLYATLLTLLVLTLSFVASAQSILLNPHPGIIGEYNMRYAYHVFNRHEACKSCNDDYWEMNSIFLNAQNTVIEKDCIGNGEGNRPNYVKNGSGSIVFSADNPITQLRTFAQRYIKEGLNNRCDERKFDTQYLAFNYYLYNTGLGFTQISEAFIEGNDYVLQQSTKTVEIFPILDKLNALNANMGGGYLPQTTKLQLKAPAGFPKAVYRWQYSLTIGANTVWQDFPSQFLGDSTIEVSGSDLISLNFNAYVNRSIYIRLKAPGPPTMNDEVLSDILVFTIAKDAPFLLSHTTQPTSCFDTNDGSATLVFNRNLSTGERLSILVKRYDTATNTWTSSSSINNLTSLTNNRYVFDNTLRAGKYAITFIGSVSANNVVGATFTGNPQYHYDTFTVQKPSAVAFTKTTTDVRCFDGDDGVIALRASGGVGNYSYQINAASASDTNWYAFATALQHNIVNLLPNYYYIKVRDSNACEAKLNGGLGAVRIDTSLIQTPNDSIHIDVVSKQDPNAYGFTDGIIHVAVYGGTPDSNGSYTYAWYDVNNALVSTHIAFIQSGAYHIQLQNIGAGTYTLVIQDGNYHDAVNKNGCTKIATIVLDQPLPLVANVVVQKMPSCNRDNSHQDPYQDGVLLAQITGGTQFPPPALPYKYTWKKKDNLNVWHVMLGYSDSIATGLEEGWYAVNVEDAKGIKLATYVNNVLTQEKDSTHYLPQHDLLQIAESIAPITCNGDTSGSIALQISGGVPSYTYSWNTGDTISRLTNIAAGGYFVLVKDSLLCNATKTFFVPEPDMFQFAVDSTNPICHNACDGTIQLQLSGGTLPYSYTWDNLALTTANINDLCADTYMVHIVDANGCGFSRRIELLNPAPIAVNMPKEMTLCNGQTALLDIAIADIGATYQWYSNHGFSSANAQVELVDSGRYIATIQDSKQCIGIDTLLLHRAAMDISADFLLPSQAVVQEEVVLVNVSFPIAEEVEWVVPAGITIIEQDKDFLRFKAVDTGVYPIVLHTGLGQCKEFIARDVLITVASDLPKTGNVFPPFIEDVKILPNPNNGVFAVQIKLKEKGTAKIRIFQSNSAIAVTEKIVEEQKEYMVSFNIPISGVYLLAVEANGELKTLKLIIQ